MSTPTYYRYKRPITNTGAITSESMDVDDWNTSINEAILAFEDSDGDIHDYSEFVSELQIVHNDVDGEDAGRDKHSGNMKRAYITNKHTLNVKLINKLPQSVATKIFGLIHTRSTKPSFYAYYQSPCTASGVIRKNFYCATINYGAQRYDRNEGKCFYDGMNFNLIEM